MLFEIPNGLSYHLETSWQMGKPGRLGYVTGIADLPDFRRFNSPPGAGCIKK